MIMLTDDSTGTLLRKEECSRGTCFLSSCDLLGGVDGGVSREFRVLFLAGGERCRLDGGGLAMDNLARLATRSSSDDDFLLAFRGGLHLLGGVVGGVIGSVFGMPKSRSEGMGTFTGISALAL